MLPQARHCLGRPQDRKGKQESFLCRGQTEYGFTDTFPVRLLASWPVRRHNAVVLSHQFWHFVIVALGKQTFSANCLYIAVAHFPVGIGGWTLLTAPDFPLLFALFFLSRSPIAAPGCFENNISTREEPSRQREVKGNEGMF